MSSKCETCKYLDFDDITPKGNHICRRHAPHPKVIQLDSPQEAWDLEERLDFMLGIVSWPAVTKGDWCGEYAPKPQEIPSLEPITTKCREIKFPEAR